MEVYNKGEIVIYISADGSTKVNVRLEDDTIWLSQNQLVELYNTSKSNVVEHIKNIFNEGELSILNSFVSGYFDFAEIQAERRKIMYMKDHIDYLDSVLSITGEKVLDGAGTISHKKALEKANDEYKKYKQREFTNVEKDYLNSLKSIEKKLK